VPLPLVPLPSVLPGLAVLKRCEVLLLAVVSPEKQAAINTRHPQCVEDVFTFHIRLATPPHAQDHLTENKEITKKDKLINNE